MSALQWSAGYTRHPGVEESGLAWSLVAQKVAQIKTALLEGRKVLIYNGTDRSRTDDLLRVKQALFQLSYGPELKERIALPLLT